MNGHIVGHSLFTRKRRHGKTWKWTQPWGTARAAPRKASSSTADARLRLLCRPRRSGGCNQLPFKGAGLRGRRRSPQRLPFEVSSEPRNRGRGRASHGGWVGPQHGQPPTRTTHTPGWKASRPRVPIPGAPGRMQRRRKADRGSGTSGSRRLPASSVPTHPVLHVVAQLDFLVQAPGYLHGRRARGGAGVLSARRPTGAGRAGGARRGGAGGGVAWRGRPRARARRRPLVLATPAARAQACQLRLVHVLGGGMWGGAKRKAGPRGVGGGASSAHGAPPSSLSGRDGAWESNPGRPGLAVCLALRCACACAGACRGPGSRPPGESLLPLRANALGRRR